MNAPKRAKSRRPACVLLVVASLFMGVVLLLSSRLSTHAAGPSGPLAMTSRWESILSAGAFTANDALGSSYHLIPADNAGLQLWRVLPAEGVQVSLHRIKTKGLGKGAPVQLLPKGTIVIGIEVNSTTSFGPCDPESFVIMVRFPVHGWIQSGPCVSKGLYSNVVLVMADELRVMARRSALAEPPPEHCITAHMLPGVDLAGGDMGPVSLAVTSPVECCALCSRHPGCGGWTIVNDKDCWLKTVGMFEQRGTVGGPASSAITSGLLPAASLTSQPADSLYPPCCALPSQNQNPGNRRPDRPSTTESASIVRITSSRLDWTSQFPIGTGLMGAMVGGTSDAEIIPISIAGFFVSRESRVATTSEAAPHVGSAQTGRATPMSAVRELYLKNDIQGARAALGRAITSGQIVYDSIPAVDVQGADDDSSSKKDTGPSRERQRTVAPLGVFEYLCDLGILFGIPLDLEDEYASESMARSGPRKAISGATDQRGRLGVLARLYSFVYKNVFASSIGTKVIEWIADTTSVLSAIHKLPPCASCKENVGSSINKIELSSYKDISDSYLDLHTGVVNSFYLKGFALPLPDNVFDAYLDAAKRLSRTSARAHLPLYHHAQERSWFASAQDDVIVGRLKGVYIRSIGNVSVQNNSNVMLLSGELISGVSDVTVSFTRDLMKSAAVDGIVYSSSKFQWPDVESKAVISEGVSTPSLISKGVIVGAATSDADIDFSSAGSKVYGVEVTLSTAPNSSTKAPNAIVCAAVVCLSRSSLESAQPQASNDDSAGRSDMPTSSNTVFCPAIDEMHIFVSSGIGKSIYKSNNNFSRVDDIPQLRHMCWSRVNDAVIRGFNRLRQRHITLFSSRKQERLAEVNFAKNSETYFAAKGVNGQYGTCTDTAAASRLASYSSGCVIERDFAGPLGTATTTEKEYASTIDRNLFSQMYNFGSYLMVSSASKSVSNLQGLWADGPTSAWSGDYHLNINLQMNYWAMHTSGMGADLSPPLINLIKTLALAGETAASSLYGCNGWVAHGFTDSSLRGHLHADGQWALCVTCGAWIGLHLWEAVLHEPIATMLINKIKAVRTIDGVFDLDELNHSIDLIQIDESPLYVLVRIFRGIALFFTEYFYISPDGAVHTGPTTSPENSYFTSKTDVQFLTMSPAIDMSILRQVFSLKCFASTVHDF